MKKVGIIAPCGAVENFDKQKVTEFFNHFSIETVIFNSCYEKFRYMAGSDELRANDIHNAFLDPSIDTIICARGGYGAIRLLNLLDFEIIKNNKKPFVGFSDVTILLLAFYKFSNLISFHGKMAQNGVLNMSETEFLSYKNSIENPTFESKLTGGTLWGGNLASIVSTFGGFDLIPCDDIILFVEDINEPDYKIDRMFQQILLNKKLKSKIKGVIFGEFIGAGKFLDEILLEFASKLGVPYEFNPQITHGALNKIVPFGLKI